ncbi:MAG: rRNA maturation RNase YbeY [Nitrospira sp.]|nr:rRNA maturation RNase YbeY [Nitrospira sp.]MCP9441891.1 rRNA maturation RNase YbeY [Nitrospira sp.]
MAVFLRVRLRWLSQRQGGLVRAAQTILESIGEPQAELSVELVGDGRMRRLNRLYRGTDRTTDVLAFAMREARSPCRRLLGDVVISVPTAMRQAKEAGRSLNEEIAALLVHGVLHLCGYDHERNEQEAERMRRREQAVLRAVETVPRLVRRRTRRTQRRL